MTASFEEDQISQVPAIKLLVSLGFSYLSPDQAVAQRGGRGGSVLLNGILESQLRKINRITYRGQDYPFTEGNVLSAVQSLKDMPFDGLIRTNEKLYDLLCLGKALPQSIMGDVKSFTFKYIDWDHPENNVYHVTDEFSVTRSWEQ